MTLKPIKKLLLFGAGRSATALIDYLLSVDTLSHTTLTVADRDLSMAQEKIGDHDRGTAVSIDITDEARRRELISAHDLVISLLPARLHHLVIEDCVILQRHLCTASYVDEVMQEAHDKARELGLMFMGELGLDPGLDHMSALQALADIKDRGGELMSFKSYTGGLVAPESDDNPWHYKVSWNPRNVVLAGQGMSTYRYEHQQKYIPYHQLFARAVEVDIMGMGKYDMYVNRDSVRYAEIYDIYDIPTIVRGTLRYRGYCTAWDALIKLGMTDTAAVLVEATTKTYGGLLDALVPDGRGSLRQRTAEYLSLPLDGDIMRKLDFLGLFSDDLIEVDARSHADVLVDIIQARWRLMPHDKDMIIMQHEYAYQMDGAYQEMKSTLVDKGEDSVRTAMSRLVGLPLAVYVELVVTGQISTPTASRPVHPTVYNPIMKRLAELGVSFEHSTD